MIQVGFQGYGIIDEFDEVSAQYDEMEIIEESWRIVEEFVSDMWWYDKIEEDTNGD